jgi:hypothetical protein
MTHAGSTTGGNVHANLLALMPGGIVMHAASNFPRAAMVYRRGDDREQRRYWYAS